MSGELFGSLAGLTIQITSDKYRMLSQRLRPFVREADAFSIAANDSFGMPAGQANASATPAAGPVRGQSPNAWQDPLSPSGWFSGFGFGGRVDGDANAGDFV